MAVTGCLPIPWTHRISPDFTGAYHHADGTPAAGMRLALSTALGDSTCRRPLVRATTDANGTFTLPSAKQREHWLPLSADMTWEPFRICAGESDSTMREAGGSNSFAGRSPEPLDCFEWEWRGRSRVHCALGRSRTAATGAHWTVGAARGAFRVFPVTDDSAGLRATVLIQWLAPAAEGAVGAVLTTAALPCGTGGCRVEGVRIAGTDSLLYVDVVDYSPNAKERTFRPGAPGRVEEMVHF